MAIVITDDKYYSEIAEMINKKLGTTSGMYPSEMATYISKISGENDFILVSTAGTGDYNAALFVTKFNGNTVSNQTKITYNKTPYTTTFSDITITIRYNSGWSLTSPSNVIVNGTTYSGNFMTSWAYTEPIVVALFKI